MGFMDKGPWQFAKDAIDRFTEAASNDGGPQGLGGGSIGKVDPICSCCESRTYRKESFNGISEVCEICYADCPVDGFTDPPHFGPCTNRPPEEGVSDAEFQKYRNKLLKKIK